MEAEKNPNPAVIPAADITPPVELFQSGAIHLQPTGEEMFEGGFVGGLHLGPSGDRLPGADPLYDGSLEAKLQHRAATKPD